MAHLILENLNKHFRGPDGNTVHAIQRLNLTVGDGELLVLVGPSGSGKTTLLRLIAGLENPDGGSIFIDDSVITHTPPEKRDVAMVFQHLALFPHLTVHDNIALPLRLRKVRKAEIDIRVRGVAELLGFVPALGRRPPALSGGEQQRVALGRALVRNPKVFLLDEPLSNLDPQHREQVRREISQLQRRLRVTMIHVTHDQAEAMAMADRLAVINRGVLEQIAAPLEIYHRPASLFVAGFIGWPAMNFLPGSLRATNGAICFHPKSANNGHLNVAVPLPELKHQNSARDLEMEVILGIRPEDIHFAAPGQTPSAMALAERMECFGGETHVHCAMDAHSLVVKTPSLDTNRIGQTVPLIFSPGRIHLFDAETKQAMV